MESVTSFPPSPQEAYDVSFSSVGNDAFDHLVKWCLPDILIVTVPFFLHNSEGKM